MSVTFPMQKRPYRLSTTQYWQMCKDGMFDGQRVELIAGEIVKMPPQSNFHSATIHRLQRELENIFGAGYWVRAQSTLELAPHGVPDPDIAVVQGSPDQPDVAVPKKALLIVEVSDSRLTYDRTAKASLYAASGIAEYWIVNIPDRQLEVRRDPQPDATQEFGHGYATLTTLRSGANASPLAAPNGAVPVDRLFFPA